MKYLEHVKAQPTHERRAHALRLAAGFVAVVALGWLAMLPVRFASWGTADAQQRAQNAQVAGVANSQQGSATLYVATSSNPYGTQ